MADSPVTLPHLVLASASPFRLSLLKAAGLEPDATYSADIDETALRAELPEDCAQRLAFGKALKTKEHYPDSYIIAADTIVACGRRHLPKATNRAEAEAALTLCSGRRIQIHTGVVVLASDNRKSVRLDTSLVQMKRLSLPEMELYLDSGDWQGKAGGLTIEGLGATLYKAMRGSPTGAVGLPLYDIAVMLQGLGYPYFEKIRARFTP